MKPLIILSLICFSFSASASEFFCEFRRAGIHSSRVITSDGLNAKAESGYLTLEMKNQRDYSVSFSVVPERADFSVGKTLDTTNSALLQNQWNEQSGRMLQFAIFRKNLKAGEMRVTLSPDRRRISVRWDQPEDGLWKGYQVSVVATCKPRI